ncbi:hypothetical protein [Roseateles sp.]|uniref:hypothetical protein n=1 Tax=Roseateles sp. TaxID=1971397 RepID=UPI00286CFD50|nr:hypothetical protein [Roseateles sp.]
MKNVPAKLARLETLAWVFVYGGMLLGTLGLFVLGRDDLLADVLLGAGGLAVALGMFLIWLRSRWK